MKKASVKIGDNFNRLTIVSRGENTRFGQIIWNCVCSCGNSHSTTTMYLKNGNVKSCGCLRREETANRKALALVGLKFGLLTVINRAGKNTGGSYKWDCICDCGGTISVLGRSLKAGLTNSCGCLRKHPIKKFKNRDSVFFNGYKHRSRLKEIDFVFSYDEFLKLVYMPCFYCEDISQRNGLDRIDSKQGYTKNNSVPCCTMCNYLKRDLTLTEFTSYLDRLSQNSHISNRINNKILNYLKSLP